MSREEHTPGPWRADELLVWAEGGGVLAQCFWVSGAITAETAHANARLFAAAPALLVALRMAAARFRHYERLHAEKGTPDGDAKAQSNADMAEVCEAAISQATASSDDHLSASPSGSGSRGGGE